MATYYIDPAAGTNGSGTQASPFNVWPTLVTGNTYLQLGGTTWTGSITVTPASVTLGAYGSGMPALTGGVSFSSTAANGVISGCTVEGYVGITINGANGVTVSGNLIQNCTYFGISDQGGYLNKIVGNVISACGGGGIELSNSGSGGDIVIFNLVKNCGTIGPGYSGIHAYGGAIGSPTGLGNYNHIAYNVVTGMQSTSYDGNGIQLDDYTIGNVVIGNVVGGNKGTGLFELGGSYNLWTYNAAIGDTGTEMQMSTQTGGPAMTGNQMWYNIASTVYQQATTDGTIAGTFSSSADPQFKSLWNALSVLRAPSWLTAAALAVL